MGSLNINNITDAMAKIITGLIEDSIYDQVILAIQTTISHGRAFISHLMFDVEMPMYVASISILHSLHNV